MFGLPSVRCVHSSSEFNIWQGLHTRALAIRQKNHREKWRKFFLGGESAGRGKKIVMALFSVTYNLVYFRRSLACQQKNLVAQFPQQALNRFRGCFGETFENHAWMVPGEQTPHSAQDRILVAFYVQFYQINRKIGGNGGIEGGNFDLNGLRGMFAKRRVQTRHSRIHGHLKRAPAIVIGEGDLPSFAPRRKFVQLYASPQFGAQVEHRLPGKHPAVRICGARDK